MARVPGVEWVQQKITEAIGGVTPGSIGAAAASHAANHAKGGSDPVTPASIGALSQAPITVTYTGSASDPAIRGGTYRVMAADITTANGYPPEMVANPPTVAYLWVQEYSTDGAKTYATQWLSTAWGPGSPHRKLWFRENYGGWRPWREIVFADNPLLRDTGWRDVSSLADPASFDFTTEVPGGSYLRWRRIGSTVHLSVRSPLAEGTVGTNAANRRNGLINGSFSSLGAPASPYIAVGYGDIASAIACSLTNSSTASRLDVQPLAATGTISASITARVLGGNVSWLTDALWPSTLPGTPA